ncbi:MAG: hypothetical protein IJ179_03890 [Oscillospiraceae bacterium]|nr:hypothetical protein [Oscillospiraceae bacterium]
MIDPNRRFQAGTTRSQRICLLVGLVLLIGKHLLVIHLPIEARHYNTDDLLMVRMAEGLVRGNWLGDYSARTLMKGCFFPMLLAGLHQLGIPYLSALDLLYGLSCVFFVRQMRFILKNRILRLIMFAVLLLDPCSYSLTNFQRVYRSSIIEIQVLFLFGSYFGLYFRYRSVPSFPTGRKACLAATLAIFAGLVLWASWNTREESGWLLPFVITASVLVMAEILRISKHSEKPLRHGLPHLLILLLPLLILTTGNHLVSLKNERVYGERVRLEEVDGNFGKALKTMYSIKNEESIPYVTVTREKLERLYMYSPSLNQIRPALEKSLEGYYGADRNDQDTEVEDGWFFWALKTAAFNSGAADTLPKSQRYWNAVCLELQAAVEDPDSGLILQKTMPSALMSPWRSEYADLFPPSMLSALKYLISYREVAPSIEPSGKAGAEITRRFERITGNLALYSDGFSEALLSSQNESYKPFYHVMCRLGKVYRTVNKPLACVSLCAYIVLLFISARAKKRDLVSGILVILGMGLSILVFLAGVCYTDLSAFPAIRYFYLIGAYPLMLGCESIAVLLLIQQFLKAKQSEDPADGADNRADDPDALSE